MYYLQVILFFEFTCCNHCIPFEVHRLTCCWYSKTCVKRPLKNRQTQILMTKDSLMKVESIAECSPWSILQYFLPALSDNWSSNPICDIFESGRFTQVLLYFLL